MARDLKLEGSVDQYLQNLPSGSISRAISDNLYGINARSKNSPLPINKDSYGYVFFTRPLMCMTDMNISNVRRMFSLLNTDKFSYQAYTRAILDPRHDYSSPGSAFVDRMNPWIPLFTNVIESLSGFPDIQLPTATSSAGLFSEQWAYVDGVPNEYESYDLNVTFRNTQGSIPLYIIVIWLYYMSNVMQGIMNPYMDMVTEDEMDYTTRIYSMTLNETRQYVTNIISTGYSFPTSAPLGAIFDYSREKPFNDSMRTLNFIFKSVGMTFNEDIVKLEFNQHGAIFNPAIAAILEHDMTSTDMKMITRDDPTMLYRIEGSPLVKIPHFLIADTEFSTMDNSYYNLNYNMLPYINLATNELEWWVHRDLINI